LLARATHCFAPWEFDGHPDHDATGRAAAIACARTETALVRYPVWAWHWAMPEDLPWADARRIPLDDAALAAKLEAIAAYHSQIAPLAGAPVVLPPDVLARFRRPFEFGTFNVVNPLGTTITTFDDRNSNLWNFNLSLKVAIPGIETAFGRAVTFHPYLIGGGGFVTYDHLNQRTNHGFLIVNGQGVLQTEDGIILNDVTVENFDSGWHTDWGWNAGGGLAWRFANKELFVESRVMGFTRRNSDFPNISWSAARQVPIVFGMNWY